MLASEPKTLVHVVSRSQRRGAETVALELASELELRGWRSELLALAPSIDGSRRPELDVLVSDVRLDLPRAIVAARRLRRELRKSQADAVLAHGGQAALVAAIAAAGWDAPPIVWQRILELPETMTRMQRSLWSWVASRMAGAVALTPRSGDELRALGFAGPVWAIPNGRRRTRFEGLDHETERARLVEQLAIPADIHLIGLVGHLVDQKRPQHAILAVKRLREQGLDAHLVVVGDGVLRPQVEGLVEALGMTTHVSLLGHREDVPRILSGLDVLLLTSRSESMTGTVIEAHMAGCPVMSYALDGIDEVVLDGTTGSIVANGDVEALAEESGRLLADTASLQKARNEASRHGQQFAMEHLAERYASALESVSSVPLRPVRVLHLMPNFGVGGAERSLQVLAEHADRRVALSEVASIGSPRRPEYETVLPRLRELGVPVHDLQVQGRADRSPVALLTAAKRLRRLCRERRIDVVNSALFEADLVARAALLFTRTRHVVHLVNTPYDKAVRANARGRGKWRFKAVRFVDRTTAPLTDSFIAITDAVRDAAVRDLNVPPHRLAVIPRGVDTHAFDAPPVVRHDDEPLKVLHVGRMVPQKAQLVLVQAVAATRQLGVDVRLTIVGEGPLRSDLEQAIETLGLRDQVLLIDPVDDVAALHRVHHVFCLPSLWEGQSNALLEAMACRRPIVVSDLPVFREVCGDAAAFATPGDPDALAVALADLAHEGEDALRRRGERARRRVEHTYSAQQCAADVFDHFATAITSREQLLRRPGR